MPAEAVANNLKLSPIAPELSVSTDLNRRLIGLHVPFMKIMDMHKYENHYKDNGTCVNVLVSVDDISDILPYIPDDA